MQNGSPPRNKRKPLLSASIGVATISYMGMQGGCLDGDRRLIHSANLIGPPIEAGIEPSVVADSNLDSGMPQSGNLLPPPRDAATDANQQAESDAAPNPDAGDAAQDEDAGDAAQDEDAARDSMLPTSGNLVPPPTREAT